MNKSPTPEEAKKAFDAFQGIKNVQHAGSGLDLELAKHLAYLHENKRYKIIMGYDEASWTSFVAQAELQPMTYEKSYRLMKIYNVYVKELGLKPKHLVGVDTNSLYRLAGEVNERNIDDWLRKARELSRSDLRRVLNFGDVDETKCDHKFETKIIKKCNICGMTEIKEKNTNSKKPKQ